jgi:hypothetical protein
LVVLELPDEEPDPVEPELDPLVLGVDPMPVVPEPRLPEPVVPELVLPEALLPPYCWMHWSRSRPVLPTHWLGRDALLLEEPLPVTPLLLEPVLGEVVLGEVVLGELLELCAQDTLARPSSAAATAALSVFTITMYAP